MQITIPQSVVVDETKQHVTTLRITEVFYSLQGESSRLGLPTVFIRLTGCPLRCQYCDTAYAFSGGEKQQISEVIATVARYNTPYVCVTGGEPLAQPGCLTLMTQLSEQGYQVSLETSGAQDISQVDQRIMKVVDIKTPDSLESSKNLLSNLQYLSNNDQVKFVICSEQDYQWSVAYIEKYDLTKSCEVLFSPSYEQISPEKLADWIIRDQLPVRFQFQLHKFLWNDTPGK